eukprot:Tbor_TRINITY_DN5118_c0_g1::TRINITY_DN5118_c0_g1_i1::g.25769::m.25769
MTKTSTGILCTSLILFICILFSVYNGDSDEDNTVLPKEHKKDTPLPNKHQDESVDEIISNRAARPENVVKWSREKHCKPFSISFKSQISITAADVNNPPKCHCLGAFTNTKHGILKHWLKTILCGPVHPTPEEKTNDNIASMKGTTNSWNMTNRRMRVIQIGANVGDNNNDPIVRFLKLEGGGLVEAALLEPVPWIFQRLNISYHSEVEGGYVYLMRNAMSTIEGIIDFKAPKIQTTGWVPQMGGISIPNRTMKSFARKGKNINGYFDDIKVKSIHFGTVLRRMGWLNGNKEVLSNKLPDVVVIDAEGYDKVILVHILDSVQEIYGDVRIPLIQYEAKHIPHEQHLELRKKLERMGYCLSVNNVDVVAVHVALDNSVDKEKCAWSYS